MNIELHVLGKKIIFEAFMKIFNETFDLIQKSMDLRFKRHGVLASNVANSETPGYRARELEFSGELSRVLQQGKANNLEKTNHLHMDLDLSSQNHIVIDQSIPVGADGNSVDLDTSMGKIAENSRAYNNAATWVGVQLRLLKSAAKGRVA
ncbi:MAG: flagellar basal body rod protein FlgB [Proteobacteria bacterium]|nr:flagellar basal body rod protein FlgB [Pseudomonadota bacterium]